VNGENRESALSADLDSELLNLEPEEEVLVCEHVTLTTNREVPKQLTTSTTEIFTSSKNTSNAQFSDTSQPEDTSPTDTTPLKALHSVSPTTKITSLTLPAQPLAIIKPTVTPQRFTAIEHLPTPDSLQSVDQEPVAAPTFVIPESFSSGHSFITPPISSSSLIMPRAPAHSAANYDGIGQSQAVRKSRYDEPRKLTRWDGMYILETASNHPLGLLSF
jgi:hypothetical protein